MAETITADMVIHDVVTRYPATVKVFHGHGLPCTACAVGARESVAGGARTHRFSPEKLELLVKDLNAAANGEPTSVAPKKAPVGKGIPLNMLSSDPDRKIKQVIAIMSGKGGVGKSLVTGLLAVSLRRQGQRVGILDGDITGPSIARMFGTRGQPTKSASGGIEPLRSKGGIKVMSMNMFLEKESDPVVWRGPMISSAIKQFYSDVDWGQLDYLLVDLPPGTSDAPMTVMQALPLDGVVIVSSPQMLATMVVMKCVNMVQQLKGLIVGVVENMSYFETPNHERYEIFGPSNATELVSVTGAPLLGQMPIDSALTSLCDAGRVEEYYSDAYEALAANFVSTLKIKR
ncbi:P-loop NTPase [Ktedonobacter racemifer]|uniref:Iron-sulfur cluster carrier protein n=1 Tax=Ktedonobacter racemifer DSM 44963 TaxID=485913 RepID=D6TD32_KTERA|nr:P-loop NTPase [Ktedonobacter racemifer]EFH90083.1 ATPase-like, ParA/MinD [Ktedonobacter racemifer DSM 44963]